MQAIADRLRAVGADRPQGTALRIVPILGESQSEPPYQTLGAKTLDRIRISELGEGGVVPVLKVENLLDERVFLMDGQGLVGAKQNRILNTDVVVPSGKAIHIPVSCVEQDYRFESERLSGSALLWDDRAVFICRYSRGTKPLRAGRAGPCTLMRRSLRSIPGRARPVPVWRGKGRIAGRVIRGRPRARLPRLW